MVDPFARIAATEEGQASNVYSHVVWMMTEGKVASEYPIDIGRGTATSSRIYLKPTGSIEPATSGSASKDGGRETFAILDESHLYITRELRNLAQTISQNTGKRKAADPWIAPAHKGEELDD